jgi:hypothetical protein
MADAVCVFLVLAAHAVFQQLLTSCVNVALAYDGLVNAVVGPGSLRALDSDAAVWHTPGSIKPTEMLQELLAG